MGDNLRNLGDQITVALQADEDGYFGRECPVKECLGYFKVTLGTGIHGPAPCHLPLLRAQRRTEHVLHAGTARLHGIRSHARGHGCPRQGPEISRIRAQAGAVRLPKR